MPEQVDTLRPVVEPKVPAGQVVQVVATVLVATVAPARAYLPTAHVTVPLHNGVFKLPVVAPNVPLGQGAQFHKFVVTVELAPASAYFPPPQLRGPVQVGEVNPAVDPYVPLGQAVHDEPVKVALS